MNSNLLILGAGQYGHVAKEVAESMKVYDKISFLDDFSLVAVGKFEDYIKLTDEYTYAIVAIGKSKVRLEWLKKLYEAGYIVPTLIHDKSYVSPNAQIEKGTIIEPMAVVHTGCIINTGCIISAGAVVNHFSTLGEGCHIDCNGTVLGGKNVPNDTKVESGTVF